MSKVKVQSTAYPKKQLSYEEWCDHMKIVRYKKVPISDRTGSKKDLNL